MSHEHADKAMQAATEVGALYPDLIAAQLSADDLADSRKTRATIERLRQKYPALFKPQTMNERIRAHRGGKPKWNPFK